jgi:beta-lactamase regulating signal transducer with metallopeptidase domain
VAAPVLVAGTTSTAPPSEAGGPDNEDAARPWTPSLTATVVGLWMLGVCVFAMRLAGGWIVARRLIVGERQSVSAETQAAADRLSRRMGIDRVVRVVQSSGVTVPMMVGWLKPIVLLPAAVLAGLAPAQIEALLAHELAHVRRHDYVVNLLQSVVETLLFYHPAVWWVSRHVRVEREHCCDDLAVAMCDRLAYATALGDLAALSAPASPALAATGGPLVDRIRRIVEPSGHEGDTGAGWVPVLAFVILSSAVIPIAVASGGPADSGPRSVAAATPQAGARAETSGPDAPQGVAGGVRRGVTGGVTGGVHGSVQGGVTAGAPGGVVGGVTTGIEEGVEGVLASGQRDVQASDARERQLRELAEQSEAIERNARQRLVEIQKQIEALALEQVDSRLKLQLGLLSTELDALNKQHTRLKERVEVGLADPAALASIESRMAALQQEIGAAARNRTIDAKQVELQRVRGSVEAELARAREDHLRAQRTLEALRTTGARDTPGALLTGTVEAAEGDPVRAGDVLVIEIRGEPDVPRAYAVQQDGTIRLPLSAPLRVQGLTATGVEQEVVRQLTARGLEHPSVAVKLRRRPAQEVR